MIAYVDVTLNFILPIQHFTSKTNKYCPCDLKKTIEMVALTLDIHPTENVVIFP